TLTRETIGGSAPERPGAGKIVWVVGKGQKSTGFAVHGSGSLGTLNTPGELGTSDPTLLSRLSAGVWSRKFPVRAHFCSPEMEQDSNPQSHDQKYLNTAFRRPRRKGDQRNSHPYRGSHNPTCSCYNMVTSRRRDSNPRRAVYKTAALADLSYAGK